MSSTMNLPGVTTPIDTDSLNDRQKLFAAEYVKDFNASQAAIRAGYSPNGAGVHGHNLLKNPKIKELIRIEKEALFHRTRVDQDYVIDKLKRLIEADMRDVAEWDGQNITLVDSDELTKNDTYAISEIANTPQGVKIKQHDKRAAIMDLSKLLGLVVEKREHSGKVETGKQFDPSKMSDEELEAYRVLLEGAKSREKNAAE